MHTKGSTVAAPVATPLHQSSGNGNNGKHSNGSATQPDSSDWLHDPLEAEARKLGPYTVADMETYLEEYEYSVELYNGWVVWQQMTDKDERTVVSTIQGMLDISARKAGYGQVLPDQTECRLDEGNDIMPDAALISWQRLENDFMLHGPNQRPLLIQCPELVIESRSPSNWRKQERLKREKYFAHGTLIVWDVDEPNKRIYVYQAENPNKPQVCGMNDVIDCEPLLPGWKRRVADIFNKRASAEAVAGEVVDEWRAEGIEIGEARGIVIGEAKGIAIGEARAIAGLARTMLQQGMDIALVAGLTGLSAAEIQAIQAESAK